MIKLDKIAKYLETIFSVITSLAWFLAACLLIIASILEINYSSDIEELAISNSNSIIFLREAIEIHFKECCR